MAIRRYLAMTATEIGANGEKMENLAYMACHFSPYSTGLSNLPGTLPPNAMLILNDRIPICGHDPIRIREQLTQLVQFHNCARILLDFQRPGDATTSLVVQALDAVLPCPVGVSECYAEDFSGPVFLPPVPPDTAMSDYLSPWIGREIWLEESCEGLEIVLSPKGAKSAPLPPALFPEEGYQDERLHCHYRAQLMEEQAAFHLWRTEEDFESMAQEAESFGITCRVGLWQDWRDFA